MHLLAIETHHLDAEAAAVDLGQSPADLVLLSFSDSDLGAAAQAWSEMGAGRPGLRLANLARLAHPMSVDLYVDQVIATARCVLIRLLGGIDYWRYGVEEVAAACARSGAALAVLPGDGRADAALRALSSVDAAQYARLDALLHAGGVENLARALRLAAHCGGLCEDAVEPALAMPAWGEYRLQPAPRGRPLAAIVFYRSHLLAGDCAPIPALAAALDAAGLDACALFADSLKVPETAAGIAATLHRWRPSVVLNATFFASRTEPAGSPLDAPGVPVLQLLLSGAPRAAWEASARGLSPADLAMQVALPEADGRLLGGLIGCKAASEALPGLEFTRMVQQPEPAGLAQVAARAAGWAQLAATPRAARRIALVLSDYPGGGQVGHAVGLDSFASAASILHLLRDAGYMLGAGPTDAATLSAALTEAPPAPILSLDAYAALFATLPAPVREAILAAWGLPEADPSVRAGHFTLRHTRIGHLLALVQPDRGHRLDRRARYHDPALPPCHGFVAFHLWLRHVEAVQALLQLGAHGSLEWLPGKAVALSEACFPAALLGGLPVIYPFICNDPGEAMAAKRRLGAVTIGHLTPPLATAGSFGAAAELERLIDDYTAADGLDRRRADLLRREILDRAGATGLLAESGVAADAPPAEALARLDAYLCDVKALQMRDGLHVFAKPPTGRAALLDGLRRSHPGIDAGALAARLDACAAAEAAGLLAALDGRFVPPGPAGAPSRGRADVLPTGRNLTTLDPRALPTRAAVTLAARAAEEVLRRHVQERGCWPRHLVLDLWGSTTLRTGGEDVALALLLLGARPVWDAGSNRVSAVEILPLAALGRPRVDVTLRISGLFRDGFEGLITLFDAAVRAVMQREESEEDNPLLATPLGARVFGPPAGAYGAGVAALLQRGAWQSAEVLGRDYLAASAQPYGALPVGDFAAAVRRADGFVHQQDQRESDLLDGLDTAAHCGGFAAAARTLGADPLLHHTDITDPAAPRARLLGEEIARVLRGRAANPAWIAGMMRHGYRGAADIARPLEALFGFAATLPGRLDAQFDLLFAATLAEPEVAAFLRAQNPAAHAAMAARFAEARARDLWRSRRNDVAEILGA